jgi:hypothetical protein
MEINGPSNILVLQKQLDDRLKQLLTEEEYLQIQPKIKMIEHQCWDLVRYMKAYDCALKAKETPPYWHEVRDDLVKYPR